MTSKVFPRSCPLHPKPRKLVLMAFDRSMEGASRRQLRRNDSSNLATSYRFDPAYTMGDLRRLKLGTHLLIQLSTFLAAPLQSKLAKHNRFAQLVAFCHVALDPVFRKVQTS